MKNNLSQMYNFTNLILKFKKRGHLTNKDIVKNA